MITDKFPELEVLKNLLPRGTVIDAELIPFKNGLIGNFQDLQKRIGRKTVSKKLQEDIPIVLMAYDLLELDGEDLREKPLWERQEKLDVLLKKFKSSDCPLLLSKVYRFKNWKEVHLEREQANKKRSEGPVSYTHLTLPTKA